MDCLMLYRSQFGLIYISIYFYILFLREETKLLKEKQKNKKKTEKTSTQFRHETINTLSTPPPSLNIYSHLSYFKEETYIIRKLLENKY